MCESRTRKGCPQVVCNSSRVGLDFAGATLRRQESSGECNSRTASRDIPKPFLHRMQLPAARNPSWWDLGAIGLTAKHGAGLDGLAIQEDRTRRHTSWFRNRRAYPLACTHRARNDQLGAWLDHMLVVEPRLR